MKKVIVVFICIVLFFIPFLWLTPGELEMGGDSNRLFLYDPGTYLRVNALYSVEPQGVGKVASNQNLLPFLLLLQFLHAIVRSPYFLMTLLNSTKLVGSFLFMYLIVVEILSRHFAKSTARYTTVAGILAGLFYALSPSVGENMRSALLTHNQVFLNPMIFYLVLRLLVTHQGKYLWFALLVTFVFSPNFSLMAPPPPFAFYPLALSFLLLYVSACLKKSIPWEKLFVGLIFFLGIHAFHTIPAVAHIIDPSSDYYARAFDAASGRNEALEYFNATLGLGKVSEHIFLTYSKGIRWTALAVPVIVFLALLRDKKRNKAFLLTAIFFLVTLFLTSANITNVGVAAYRMFFYIPGFSMFRVFYGQWQWVHAFFYALLFGLSLSIVFSRLKQEYVYIASIVPVSLFVISGWSLISGNILRAVHPGSKNMTSIIRMNPQYEHVLSRIRALPDDGKIINVPFSDYFYQVVPGTNNAAYIGPSPTSYLTGKRSFSGYQIIYPFPEIFLKLVKEKNYAAIKRLLGILNIRYILYTRDPKAFTQYYPSWPYSLFLGAVPTPEALGELVDALRGETVFEDGDYVLYKTDNDGYLPHFYVPTSIQPYDHNGEWYGKNVSFFVDDKESDPRVGYLDRKECQRFFSVQQCARTIEQGNDTPTISFQRINPVKYRVEVLRATAPFVLAFSDQFHSSWKAFVAQSPRERRAAQQTYFNGDVNEYSHENVFLDSRTFEALGMKSIPEHRHGVINGYANAWLITPEDASGAPTFEIIIEMTQQRLFYYGLGISVISFFVLCISYLFLV